MDNGEVEKPDRKQELLRLAREVAGMLGHDFNHVLADEGAFLRYRAHVIAAAHARKEADKRMSEIRLHVHGGGRL